jgi:hypothetical protein
MTQDIDIEIEIAKIILLKSGILENRAIIVQELEKELELIYSEIDGSFNSTSSDTPIRYYEDVQTEFDLISNNEIHRSLYKLQTKEQRLFIRKITHHEDYYFAVNRGQGYNFFQEWDFHFKLKKEDFLVDYDEIFSFIVKIGVRDVFPYEIEVTSFGNIINQNIVLTYFKIL